ncbi:MAG: phosphotransferase, partial [Defluviitaleaceae bacterium]|nr:phosphotransferase [Defluviitaleaceae bacterium]
AHMNIRYAYQTLDALPAGYTVPEDRVKPWGTAHAVLCAKPYINGPFAVINADDFYGAGAYRLLYHFLASNVTPTRYCMVGYKIENTLTESGGVARGICTVKDGNLAGIQETLGILPAAGGAVYTENGQPVQVPAGTMVSMNVWGFDHSFLDEIESGFAAFLDEGLKENPLKCEYFLPSVVGRMVTEDKAVVEVLPTKEKWYGVTYADDMPAVRRAIRGMITAGVYPEHLWAHENIPAQIYDFVTSGDPIFATKYGSGHINETYLVVDSIAREYILQKINQNVFRDPVSLMENVQAVTAYLKANANDQRETLSLIPTKAGQDWLVDEDGEYWRLYPFISDSICLQKAENMDEFKDSGFAFGHFQKQLAGFPAGSLTETIPRFHDTPNRYTKFKAALAADPCGRAKDVAEEIAFALEREAYANTLMDLLAAGDIPLRVTHNDTKLNNVLFDRETKKPLCVIDLDTVMPGLSVNDFGDSIRFGASTAAEDEQDLSKVNFSLPLFAAYAEGFLAACGDSLTPCELAHLRDGAKMMTLECGVRFLTDYLEGDVYFKTSREGQNLDRCRTQFKLVREMEAAWDDMQRIVQEELEAGI